MTKNEKLICFYKYGLTTLRVRRLVTRLAVTGRCSFGGALLFALIVEKIHFSEKFAFWKNVLCIYALSTLRVGRSETRLRVY